MLKQTLFTIIMSLLAASAYAEVSMQGGTFQAEKTRIEIGEENLATESGQFAFRLQVIRDGDIVTDKGTATLVRQDVRRDGRLDVYKLNLNSGKSMEIGYSVKDRFLFFGRKLSDSIEERMFHRKDKKDLSLFTYKTTSLGNLKGLSSSEVKRVVDDSWMKWRTVGNILLRHTPDSRTPSIEIIAAYPNSECNCFPETIVGPPTFTNIKIYIDATAYWTKESLTRKITHELGHALGLNDEDSASNPESVMADQMLTSTLSQEDRRKIIKIYGPAPTPTVDSATDEEIRAEMIELLIELGIITETDIKEN